MAENGTNHIILPEPTLRRLPWYLAYIDILGATGVTTVSSTQISKALNVASSQIAKDLSFLKVKGKTRIGYEIDVLREELLELLGFNDLHKAIVVGAGSLGGALMHDTGLTAYGLSIVAGFDVNPNLVGSSICTVPVYHIDDIKSVRETTGASIGILTVPADSAQKMADAMVEAGIRAIWNFTPYRIKVSKGVVLSNTSIYAHLALIYNRLGASNTLD